MKWSFKKVTAMIAILVVLAGGIFLAAYLKEVADYKRSVREIAIEEICLSDIHILEHENERGQAAEVIIDKIVSEQRIDVDAVSGATNSSTVLKKAVESALLLPEMQTGKID